MKRAKTAVRLLLLTILAAGPIQSVSFGQGRAQEAVLEDLAKLDSDGRLVIVRRRGDGPEMRDLHDLARFSEEVVIGVAGDNHCQLSPDGRAITTDFRFRVEESLFGRLRPGQEIVVSLPGGMIVFDNGVTAEVQTPWFVKMELGSMYVLFLEKKPHALKYETVGGPQGAFRLDQTNRVVKTLSGVFEDPVWTYDDMGVEEFLSLLRWAIRDGHRTVAEPPGR